MKLLKIILPLGIIIFLTGYAVAQKRPLPKSQPVPPGSVPPQQSIRYDGNTLLWKISGNSLQQPSYMFGTMHILCSDDVKLGDSLKNVIKNVGKIYFEVDMDDMMEMMGVMAYIRMNNNQKLSDLLTPEEYKKLQDYFTKNPFQMPLQMMETFKPFFISSIIEEQRMTCPNKKGMEQLIMDEATQYKKEIKGLETMKFQASVFDSIPYKEQAKELVKSLDSLNESGQQTKELIAVYKQQDLGKIEALSSKEDAGMDKYMDLLLYNRNTDWVTKIGNLTPTGSYLFAVGAAHLAGNRGVLNLLRQKGYTVTPVKNTFE